MCWKFFLIFCSNYSFPWRKKWVKSFKKSQETTFSCLWLYFFTRGFACFLPCLLLFYFIHFPHSHEARSKKNKAYLFWPGLGKIKVLRKWVWKLHQWGKVTHIQHFDNVQLCPTFITHTLNDYYINLKIAEIYWYWNLTKKWDIN